MRTIRHIVVHCSAGNAKAGATAIVNFHTLRKSRGGLGWSVPGYHFIIEADGKTVQTLDVARASNGVKGHNADSINICYCGGVDSRGIPKDTRTEAQKSSLVKLLTELKRRFPGARICGHRDFSPDRNGDGIISPCEWIKACPSFDAQAEYRNL